MSRHKFSFYFVLFGSIFVFFSWQMMSLRICSHYFWYNLLFGCISISFFSNIQHCWCVASCDDSITRFSTAKTEHLFLWNFITDCSICCVNLNNVSAKCLEQFKWKPFTWEIINKQETKTSNKLDVWIKGQSSNQQKKRLSTQLNLMEFSLFVVVLSLKVYIVGKM